MIPAAAIQASESRFHLGSEIGLSSGTPHVSLILPSFNEGEKLRQTVESLLANTRQSFEILVVDNGSTDGSSDFLRDLSPNDAVRLLRTQTRLGVVGARHAGADQARGEVLVFCDAHMLFPRDWLTPLLAELSPEVGLVGPAISIWGQPEGPLACGSVWEKASLELAQIYLPNDEPADVAIIGGGCQVMRRDLFRELGGYDSGMVDWGIEDQELCLRLWTLGYRVRVVPLVRVQHYYRDFVPYAQWPNVTYNKLRMVLTHFSDARVTTSVKAISQEPGFTEAFARVADSDVWDRRAALEDRRVHDAEWFFARFAMTF